jgi:hypothetical protein
MLSMVRSRMFTPAFRFFAALAAFGLVGAFTLAFTSGQSFLNAVLGPISVGWKGGVGNHFTYTVMVSLGAVAGTMAVVLVALRDADPEAEAEAAQVESLPLTRAPSGTNFLPLVGAFGVGIVLIGQLTNQAVTLAGMFLLAAVTGVWMLRTWAERATGDDEVNRELYQRFVEPFRVPILSALVIAVVVLGLSRVLLAVSKVAAVAVFGIVSAVVLMVAIFVASKPKISKNAVTLLLFIGACAVIAAGIAAAMIGQREIDHHGDEGHSTEVEEPASGEGGTQEGGLGPIVVIPSGGN